MKADLTTKLLLTVIAILLGTHVIGNQPAMKNALASGGGGEMISAAGSVVYHLKDGKIRICYINSKCDGWF